MRGFVSPFPRVIRDARLLAVNCLYEIERQKTLVPEAMERLPHQLSDEDRNLAHELVYGSLRFLPGLARVLAGFCNKARTPPRIFWLLIVSLYQLRFLRIPSYAVLNEANRLTLDLKFKGLKPLVNGVLRNITRAGEEIWSLEEEHWLLPPWLSSCFSRHFPPDQIRGWLSAWNEHFPISYWSVNETRLEDDPPSAYLPHAFRRNRSIDAKTLARARVYIQNESSQAIAEMVLRSASRSVLDFCAAPGGKACYLAAFGELARLVAHEPRADRMARLHKNRGRLGLAFETVQDAASGPSSEDARFDLVMVDAPCTGIGIIGRHPEIKLLKDAPADERLRQKQAQIAASAWKWVKKGGYLLYTVCSLDPGEVPAGPADAQPAPQQAKAWLPTGIPRNMKGARFRIDPVAGFDGFQGILLRKDR